MKYKAGDKARIINNKKEYSHRKEYIGLTVTVKRANPNGNCVYDEPHYSVKESIPYIFFESELVPVNTRKIVITSDGKETLARLYDGNKVIKSATAKCSPDDTFDFETGAKIAFDRLIDPPLVRSLKSVAKAVKKCGEALRGITAAVETDSENQEWRVVNRPARVGDYIRIVKKDFGFDEIGDILKVDKVSDTGSVYVRGDNPTRKRPTARDNEEWIYFPIEFEIVEPVTVKKEKPFKFEVGKQYADGDNVIEITDAKNEGICFARYYYKDIKGDTGASKTFTDGSAFANRLTPYDPPKYYNGKAVYVGKAKYPRPNFTIGKVYEFKDGRTTTDNGVPVPVIRAVTDLNDSLVKDDFIPFVE